MELRRRRENTDSIRLAGGDLTGHSFATELESKLRAAFGRADDTLVEVVISATWRNITKLPDSAGEFFDSPPSS